MFWTPENWNKKKWLGPRQDGSDYSFPVQYSFTVSVRNAKLWIRRIKQFDANISFANRTRVFGQRIWHNGMKPLYNILDGFSLYN